MKDIALHVAQWKSCEKCAIGCSAFKHVLFRTSRKATNYPLMLIGEAPGETEDLVGRPFAGRSGRLLDQAIHDAVGGRYDLEVPYLITNALACRPIDSEGYNRIPTEEEIANCRPRVLSLIKLAKPKVVLCLGKTAERFGLSLETYDGTLLYTYHPSYLLRSGGVSSTRYPDYVLQIRSAFKQAKQLQEVLNEDQIEEAC